MYDLIIIGGGPAGVSAAVYAARKRLGTLFITDTWGGQSNVSDGIENWIGTLRISGADLAKNLREHVEKYAGDSLKILSGTTATGIAPHDDTVEVTIKDGTRHETKTLLIASGAARRKLEVPGAAEYDQKGLTYCASCDGPLFDGKDVAVVGGGNAAFETALQLVAYCKSVTLLNRSDVLRADAITITAASAHHNLTIIKNAVPVKVEGAAFVNGLRYMDAHTKEERLLPVEGIFVEIGLLPNTEWLGNTLALNEFKQIKVDPRTGRTSHKHIWAAGDVTDGLYHQNNIASGDAVKALEDIYMAVHREGM